MVKQKQWNTIILTIKDYKNSGVGIREIYQKKKKRKKDDKQGIDIKTCLIRKNKKKEYLRNY